MKLVIAALLFLSAQVFAAGNKLPFSYLNQYYTYKTESPSSFKINADSLDFNDFSIEKEDGRIHLKITDKKFFTGGAVDLIFFDSDLKTLGIQKISAEQRLDAVIPLNDEKTAVVCLSVSGDHTIKRFCQNTNRTEPATAEIIFKADSTVLNKAGLVVLNEKNKTLDFKVLFKNSYFEIITGHRNIIPRRIFKSPFSENLSVDFVDLEDPFKYRFSREIKMSDTSFLIDVDDLISIYQDFVFNDDILLSSAVEYEFNGWLPKKIVTYNKLGIEPVGLYSQLSVNSSQIDAKIISDLSTGFRVYYHNYPDNFKENYYSAKITLLQIHNDVRNTPIDGKSLNLLALAGGQKTYVTPAFLYDLGFSLEEIALAESDPGNSGVIIVKAFVPKANFILDSQFWKWGNWSFNADAGLGLIGPAGIPSGATQVALNILAGMQASYKIRWGRFYYGFEYISNKLQNSTYRYQYQALEHKIGFYYLF